MTRHLLRRVGLAAVLTAAIGIGDVQLTRPVAAEDASSFVGLAPGRLADSRQGGSTVDGVLAGGGPRAAGSVTVVPIGGRAGVPGSAAAVALNVTVTEAAGAGYASVYPCGSEPPNASNLNFTAGQTIPNAAVVKVGQDASVCVFVSEATQLIVDVGGYFPAGSSFVGLAPGRLADSRPGGSTVDGTLAGGGPHAAGSVTVVPIGGRAGVPGGAAAVALNVTVTQAQGAGYATVYPCGSEPPNASNLNFSAGQTIANAAVVKVGQSASVCVFVSEATQLIVDVGGYFPAGSSFVGLTPGRLADSRPGGSTVDGTLAGGDMRAAGSVTVVPVAGRAGLPANAAAVTLNVTVTQAAGAGYASVYPCGSEPPNASNLNFTAGQTIANAAVVKVGQNASVCVFVSEATQLIVDVGGYFSGGAIPPPTSSAPPNPIPFNKDEVFSLDSPLTKYWVYVPDSYDASHQTPTTLFVWLHGCGGQSEFDIYTVSPGDDQSWISVTVGGREGGCWIPADDATLVKAAIADIKRHFNVDPQRVILGGYSSGGNLAYRTAFYDAGSFAGVLAEDTAAFSYGGANQAEMLAAASWKFNVVHLAHLQDETFPIGTVRAEIGAMQAAGFPATLIERTGTHYDEPGAIVDGQVVPGTDADLVALLLPHIDDGWRSP